MMCKRRDNIIYEKKLRKYCIKSRAVYTKINPKYINNVDIF